MPLVCGKRVAARLVVWQGDTPNVALELGDEK
jgi:hypothetical protein